MSVHGKVLMERVKNNFVVMFEGTRSSTVKLLSLPVKVMDALVLLKEGRLGKEGIDEDKVAELPL